MPRSFKTILACVLLITCLSIFPNPKFVEAAMYEITATSLYWQVGSWWLIFGDVGEPDGRFNQQYELAGSTFSGVDLYSGYGRWDHYTMIQYLPSERVYPFAGGFGAEGASFWTDTGWWWGCETVVGLWTFTVNPYTADPVPLPPTVWLLGSGLLGLAGWRRFRKG
jgi:hypothetical protein